MSSPSGQFVMSTEIECLTAVRGYPARVSEAVGQLLKLLSRLAPSVRGTAGIFTPYGKVYNDTGEGPHLELAAMECESPYLLAQVVETQIQLVSRALAQLNEEGSPLLLVANNHDGLLQDGCAVWGAHENYLLEKRPATIADQILPFLVTRIYQGAGGIHFPSGRFLAAVRPIAITCATGGGTTHRRAIHSTARDENHMGPNPTQFRYHGILGDGHRCQFNLALQFGATALALKAATWDPELPDRLSRMGAFRRPDWLALLHRCNLLAEPGKPLQVDPLVLQTQRLYLERAESYLDGLDGPRGEPWQWLADWRQTLDALERMDRKWLSARLDAFAKYEFYSAVLEDAGCSWKDLPKRPKLFRELALLDHSYHELGNPESVFCQLERAGLLDHRVVAPVVAGEEHEPYVPETVTRARARARFVKEHQGDQDLRMDWSCICNLRTGQVHQLHDPFAAQYVACPVNDGGPSLRRERPERRGALGFYERGDYRQAQRYLETAPEPRSSENLRQQAWVRARLGYDDGAAWLDRLYAGRPHDLVAISDYLCVWRFCGLAPDGRIGSWIERGRDYLDPVHPRPDEPVGADVFREHLACTLLHRGEVEQARQVLETGCRNRLAEDHIKARMLVSLAAAYRRLGNERAARAPLDQAKSIQHDRGYLGDLADFTLTELARLQRRPAAALDYLAQAEAIQAAFGNVMGMTRTLLLRARLAGDAVQAEQTKAGVLQFRGARPALAGCPLLASILGQWEAWVAGEIPGGENDAFWGL